MDGITFIQILIFILETGLCILILASVNKFNKVLSVLNPIFDYLKGVFNFENHSSGNTVD